MRSLFFLGIVAAGVVQVGASPLMDFSYGVLEELRGEKREAVEFYKKAYAADPLALPLARIEANRLMEEGDRPAALDVYRAVVAGRPQEPLIHIEFGDFVGRVGKGDSLAEQLREECYRKVLEVFPGGYLPVERLVRLAREQGNDRRARKILEELSLDSVAAVLYFVATTKSLYDVKDAEAASRIDRAFEKGVKEHPGEAGLARKASDHFKGTGRLDRAISLLGEHVDAVPSSLDMKVRQGILMFSAKRDSEGLQILGEVLDVYPRKAMAHEALAKYYRLNGAAEKARNHAAELLKIRGGGADDFLKLAEELMADAEFREARLLLEKAVFVHEEDIRLRMKLAMATAHDPETEEAAARLFREAELMLEKGGEMDLGFMLDSARQLLAQGESKAAEDRLRTAIKTFPKKSKGETAAALRALADIWLAEGRNLDAAQALIRRAEALDN